MARLRGTGKDPEGRYGEGQIFDVPEEAPLYEDLLDRGWAEEVAPEDDPGRAVSGVAQAVVQQQALTDPVEQEIAEDIEDRAHDIVQAGHRNAKRGEAGLSPGKRGSRPNRRQDRQQRDPAQVSALSRASHDPEGYEEFATGSRESGRGQEASQFASSAAEEKAAELGVSADAISGSGSGGKITVGDVEDAAKSE